MQAKRVALRRFLERSALPCLVILALCPRVHAQQADSERKSVEIVRTDTPPVIDGHIDEPDWSRAAVIDDLHQMTPIEYTEPSQRTEIRLLYDDDALYIAARMWDTEAEKIVSQNLRQGQQVWGDDFFGIVLDPFNDQRSGYLFMLNANGVRVEALYLDISKQQWNWQGIWETAGTQDDQGWSTEVAIPFKSLSFDPQNDAWGINFRRQIARDNENVGWVSRNRTMNPSVTGVATGLRGLDQGLGLDIVPSVSAVGEKDFSASATESNVEPSLDLFYKVTPALNGALTINTDFSATEVDDRQVDLTRFSLFFPEKRAFFLQDSDIFEFGRLGGGTFNGPAVSRPSLENGRPYFSRRLGLSATGEPVDIDYGGRLSGRIGRWSIGALTVRQDAFQDVDPTDAFVGRAALNVLAESTIGMIVTNGDPRSNLDNTLVGADFRYLNSRLPGGRILEWEAWYQQTDTEGLSGDDGAWGFRLRSPNNSGFRGGIGVKEIQENFNPALGFVNRPGIRDHTVELGYTHIPDGGRLTSILSRIDAQRIDLVGGGSQSQLFSLIPVQVENGSRDKLTTRYILNKEVIAEPFEISDGVIIPIGEYSFDEYGFDLQAGNQRRVSGSFSYRQGEFFDGDRQQLQGSITWAPSRHFRASAGYEYNDVDLPQGDFVVRLVTLQAGINFSSTLSWINLIQYDNVSETAGINSRLHWIPEAGREMFIVLNHNLENYDRTNSFHSLGAELTVKFSYTFRF